MCAAVCSRAVSTHGCSDDARGRSVITGSADRLRRRCAARRVAAARPGALYGLTRRADDAPKLRAHGIVPIVGDLDDFTHARRLARRAVRGAAFRAAAWRRPRRSAHAETPRRAGEGAQDTTAIRLHFDVGRLRRLRRRAHRRNARRAARRRRARSGASPPRIGSAHGRRGMACALAILRAPGIYADDAAAARAHAPAARRCSRADDDVYTNHIHADDLARATVAAMFHGRPNRAYNVTDDAELKMGGWFDAVADAFKLPRPPRVTLGGGRAAHRAAAAVVHERVAPAVERADEARTARAAALSDAAGAARRSRAARPEEAACRSRCDARRSRPHDAGDRCARRWSQRASTPTSGCCGSTSRSARCCCCGRR